MKAYLFLVIFLLVLPLLAGQEEGPWIYTSSGLKINIVLAEEIEPVQESSASTIDFVRVNISFFPREIASQEIVAASHSPIPTQTESTVILEWEKPPFATLPFRLAYTVQTTNIPIRISRKIPFPARSIPAELVSYTYPQTIIDSDDPAIQQLAAQLAEGETDLLVVLHKLASWTVQNVEYNLSTVTAKASKPASWVLQNRQGVCDELTSLFIAMVRSLGIPARFVSGISYTNSPLFTEKWGPHGWAEVYVPSVGWVPYDVTYEEFGFVDPTHIVAKYSKDAAETSLEYEWRGKDVQLKTGELSIHAEAVGFGEPLQPSVRISLRPWKEKTGFGSFNAILAEVENQNNFYQSIALTLSDTAKTTLSGQQKQLLLLKPLETKTVAWLIQVDQNLDEDFVYTFPFSVQGLGLNATTEFTASRHQSAYAKEEVLQDIGLGEERMVQSPYRIEAQCTSQRQEYRQGEKPSVTCSVRNIGARQLTGRACVLEDCRSIAVPIMRDVQLQYTVDAFGAGKQQYLLTIDAEGYHTVVPFSFLVLDPAALAVTDLSVPASVQYGEAYPLKFRLTRESETIPANLTITITLAGLQQSYFVQFLDADREFTVNLDGADLDLGMNNISISVEYTDTLGTRGAVQEQIPIALEPPTLMQRFAIYIKGIGKWMARLFS